MNKNKYFRTILFYVFSVLTLFFLLGYPYNVKAKDDAKVKYISKLINKANTAKKNLKVLDVENKDFNEELKKYYSTEKCVTKENYDELEYNIKHAIATRDNYYSTDDDLAKEITDLSNSIDKFNNSIERGTKADKQKLKVTQIVAIIILLFPFFLHLFSFLGLPIIAITEKYINEQENNKHLIDKNKNIQ